MLNFTIGCEKMAGLALLLKPANFVNFFFNLQGLQIVEFGFVAGEVAIHLVRWSFGFAKLQGDVLTNLQEAARA